MSLTSDVKALPCSLWFVKSGKGKDLTNKDSRPTGRMHMLLWEFARMSGALINSDPNNRALVIRTPTNRNPRFLETPTCLMCLSGVLQRPEGPASSPRFH